MLFAIGHGEKVVGVTLNDTYPPEVRQLPKVGDQSIDFEKLLSLEPDLVVLDANLNKDRSRIEALGVEVFELRCARLEDVAPAMRALARRLGDDDSKGKRAAEDFEKALSEVKPLEVSGKVFVEVWGEPLMTAGSETLFSDVLSLLGLENSYADQGGYFQVEPEELLSRSPDFVLLPISEGTEPRSKAISLSKRVGQNPRLIPINSDYLVRPGPRIVEGIHLLRNELSKDD
jgi:iron complex transport system substrate-binding protein